MRVSFHHTSAVLSLALCACAAPSTVPTPRDDPGWQQAVDRLSAAARGGPYDVVFIGDSITEGWAHAGRDVWRRHYTAAGSLALNLGISGDRTEHLLWRLAHGNLKGLEGARQPKVIVLMIGTNNLRRDRYVHVGQGIVAVTKLLRARLPQSKVLLMAILPRGRRPGRLRKRAWRASQLAKDMLLREHGVHFVDISRSLLDDAGELNAQIAPDALHLSAQGYARWADAIAAPLARLMK